MYQLPEVVFPSEQEPNTDYPIPILITIILLSLSVFTRPLFFRYQEIVSTKLLIIVYTLIFVIMVQQIPDFKMFERNLLTNMVPRYLLALYLPVIYVQACFKPNLVETLLKGFPGALSSVFIGGLIHGICLKINLHADWTITDAFVYGAIASLSQASLAHRFLSEAKFRISRNYLHGEGLITICLCLTIMDVYLGYKDGMLTVWYEFMSITIRLIIGGAVVGYVCSIPFAVLINLIDPDVSALPSIIVSMAYIVFYLGNIANVNAAISLLVFCMRLFRTRHFTIRDSHEVLNYFFDLYYMIITKLILIYCLYFLLLNTVSTNIKMFRGIFFNYCAMMASRTIAVLAAYPFTRIFGQPMSPFDISIVVWSMITCETSLIISIILIRTRTTYDFGSSIVILIGYNLVITHLINSTTIILFVRSTRFETYSINQRISLEYCVRIIMAARDRCIFIWKMRSIMSDVRWDLVRKLSILKNPFHSKGDPITLKDQQLFSLVTKKATCPDCKIEITAKSSEKSENIKRHLMHDILYITKTIIIRKHHAGGITLECFKILLENLYKINDEETLSVVRLDIIKTYFPDYSILVKLNKKYNKFFKFHERRDVLKPRNKFRATCWRIMRNTCYILLTHFFNLISLTPIILYQNELYRRYLLHIYLANMGFALLFFVHVFFTVMAYSWIRIREGIALYFKSLWNVIDFFILLSASLDILLAIMFILMPQFTSHRLWEDLLYVRLVRLLRVLHIFNEFMPRVLSQLQNVLDNRAAIGFEMAKTVKDCYDEILSKLNSLVDNVEMREEMRERIHSDRCELLEMLAKVQIERPWIARRVKMLQVLFGTIRSMTLALDSLKTSGYVDDNDFEKLENVIKTAEAKTRFHAILHEPTIGEIFISISWLVLQQSIPDYLLVHSTTRTYPSNTIICDVGDFSNSVYIIISGVCKLFYTPNQDLIEQVRENGTIPIIDYIEFMHFDKQVFDFLIPGNSFGELSLLTRRPYSCRIVTQMETKVLVIEKKIIQNASRYIGDPVDGLEERMWKYATINLAARILLSTGIYESLTITDVAIKLERAFVPNISCYSILNVVDVIEDIILLDGIIVDYYSKDIYVAPCYIPRSVVKICMAESSFVNIRRKVEAKLMFIPMEGLNKYDIMEHIEGIAELRVNHPDCYLLTQSKVGIQRRDLRRKRKRIVDKVGLKAKEEDVVDTHLEDTEKFLNVFNTIYTSLM